MSSQALKNELRSSIVDLQQLQAAYVREAESKGIPPLLMKDANGTLVLVPVIVAKVQALSALAYLEKPT